MLRSGYGEVVTKMSTISEWHTKSETGWEDVKVDVGSLNVRKCWKSYDD